MPTGLLQNPIASGNLRLGTTDLFEAPLIDLAAALTTTIPAAAWTYLGVVEKGSLKQSNAKKVYDLETGVPMTVKKAFAIGVEGKLSCNLQEITGQGLRTAGGGIDPRRLYDAVATTAAAGGSTTSVVVVSLTGLNVGDEIEVATASLLDFGDGVENTYVGKEITTIQAINVGTKTCTVYPKLVGVPTVPGAIKKIGGYEQANGTSIVREKSFLTIFTDTGGNQVVTVVPKARAEGIDLNTADGSKEALLPLSLQAFGVLANMTTLKNQAVISYTYLLKNQTTGASMEVGGVLNLA